MSTTSQLIEFAKSSGAFWMKRGTGIALTWDSGIYWHNLWTEHDDQGTLLYKYGPSERWEDRSTFVASPFEDWTAKGAIIHVGEFARSYLGWDPIVIPQVDSDPVAHPYVYSQFFPWVGGLELDGKVLPLTVRTMFPTHRELTEFAHIASVDSQSLLDAYMSEDGGILRNWIRRS